MGDQNPTSTEIPQPRKKGKKTSPSSVGSSLLPRPLRILCLHGYRQNGSVFEKKTGAFRKLIRKEVKECGWPSCDLIFVTAPNKVEDPEMEDAFAWMTWPTEEHWNSCSRYLGFEESIEFLRKIFLEQGPFDGVIGFSQGGVIASILSGMRSSTSSSSSASASPSPSSLFETSNPISFKFVMIFSAFLTPVSTFRTNYMTSSSLSKDLISLHGWGKRDELIPPENSSRLADWFSEASSSSQTSKFEHSSGHVVPTDAIAKTELKSFIKKATEFIFSPPSPSTPMAV